MFRFDRYKSEETNDCTVRTLSNLLGISYRFSHDILTYYGREANKGFHWEHLMETLSNDFEKLYYKHDDANIAQLWVGKNKPKVPVYRKIYTVSQALKKYNKGRFAFMVHGHVFTVIDGVMIDTFKRQKQRKHIVGIYKYRHSK